MGPMPKLSYQLMDISMMNIRQDARIFNMCVTVCVRER